MTPPPSSHRDRCTAPGNCTTCGTRPMSGGGVSTGIMLGVLNALVIAIGLSVSAYEPRGHFNVGIGMFVFMFATIPAVITGAIVGAVADLMKKQPRWLRLPVLVVPAVGLVALLAYPFNLQQYIPVACIPTLVAAVVLERATRYREPSPVPVARVESVGHLAR